MAEFYKKTKDIEKTYLLRKQIKREVVNEKENRYRFYTYIDNVKLVFYQEAHTYIIKNPELFPLI